MMRAFSLVIVLALASGCRSPHDRPESASAAELEASQVLSIAQRAFAERGGFDGEAQFTTPVRQTDGSWRVLVLQVPSTPGGHVLISIDAQGGVTGFVPGA